MACGAHGLGKRDLCPMGVDSHVDGSRKIWLVVNHIDCLEIDIF